MNVRKDLAKEKDFADKVKDFGNKFFPSGLKVTVFLTSHIITV